MTIQEKAIEQLERISEHLSAIGEKEDYTDIAIKALEQEDALEKIRAEIELKAHSGQWSDATMYGMLKAVAIIDKYRK